MQDWHTLAHQEFLLNGNIFDCRPHVVGQGRSRQAQEKCLKFSKKNLMKITKNPYFSYFPKIVWKF